MNLPFQSKGQPLKSCHQSQHSDTSVHKCAFLTEMTQDGVYKTFLPDQDYIVTSRKTNKHTQESCSFNCVHGPDGCAKCLSVKAMNSKVQAKHKELGGVCRPTRTW